MTLNGVMALILRYFNDFAYDVVVKQLLGLSRFHNLLLIIYDRTNNRSENGLDGRVHFNDGEYNSGLITGFDGRRCLALA